MRVVGARPPVPPVVVAVGCALSLAGPAAPPAAAARPAADLAVRSASVRVVSERLVVDLVAANAGRRGARANTSTVSWSQIRGRRAGRLVVLRRFSLAALRARRHRAVHLRVALPAGASGVFAVRVCLDVRATVGERRRGNNCRSAGEVAIAASEPAGQAPGAGAPDATPGATTSEPSLTLGAPAADTQAPETTIDMGPRPAEPLGSATFLFGASEKSSRLDCRLDGGEWAYCSSPKAYSGLKEGTHTFEVRATDAAGNTDPTPASFTWRVDLTRPGISITGGPSGTVATAGASFAFASPDDAGATFECRLDAAVNWAPCTSPRQLTGLADGSHTFSVRAVDAASNVSSPAASRTWTVDTGAPDTTITSGPSGAVVTADASFTFQSGDAGARFECRLDGGGWAACSSPEQLPGLADGQHTFDVRAVDAVGNADATPASRTWTVDTTAPDTTITSGPSGEVPAGDVQFGFASADGDAAFECRVDGGDWAVCVSPLVLSTPAPGPHTFEVRAVDAAGNRDASPAAGAWTSLEPAP